MAFREILVLFDSDSIDRLDARMADSLRSTVKSKSASEAVFQSNSKLKNFIKSISGESVSVVQNTRGDSPKADIQILPLKSLRGVIMRMKSDELIEKFEKSNFQVFENQSLELISPVPDGRDGVSQAVPLGSQPWHVTDMLGTRSQNIPSGDGVRVAVLDTGCWLDHPEFERSEISLWRFRNQNAPFQVPSSDSRDIFDHGTGVTSLVCGNLSGVARKCSVVVCDVFRGRNADLFDVVQAMEWIGDGGNFGGEYFDIINCSFGSAGRVSEALTISSRRLVRDKGIFVVGAIGNDYQTKGPGRRPASYPECLSVGAYDSNQLPCAFSNRGDSPEGIFQPDIWAPGGGLLIAGAGGGFRPENGTSFAAPIVTGLAAMAIQSDKALRKNPKKLRERLLEMSVPNDNLARNARMARWRRDS